MADRSSVFTLPGAGTTSNEILAGDSGSMLCRFLPAHGRNESRHLHESDRQLAPEGNLHLDGTTRTQIKAHNVAADDLLWFETPISGSTVSPSWLIPRLATQSSRRVGEGCRPWQSRQIRCVKRIRP